METAGCENILIEKEIDKRIKMFWEKLDRELGKMNLKKYKRRNFGIQAMKNQ